MPVFDRGGHSVTLIRHRQVIGRRRNVEALGDVLSPCAVRDQRDRPPRRVAEDKSAFSIRHRFLAGFSDAHADAGELRAPIRGPDPTANLDALLDRFAGIPLQPGDAGEDQGRSELDIGIEGERDDCLLYTSDAADE